MNNELAIIIKENRIKKGYSQKQLADLVGVSKSYINKIEHSNTKQPSIQVLNRLSMILQIDFVDLIESANYEVEDILINENLFNDFINRYESSHLNNDIQSEYTKNNIIDINKVIIDYKEGNISNIDATYLFIVWTIQMEEKRTL